MLVPVFLHDLCFSLFVLSIDWFDFYFIYTYWYFFLCYCLNELLEICMSLNWVCVCLCVTVGAAPSRECTRLGAVCRRTLWRRASPHSSSYPIPSPRAHPVLSHSPTNRHYLISPSPCSCPLRIPRPSPDGWARCIVGLWGQWGWGGRVTGHGHICSRTGWDSHGSGETGECAGPHRAFYCECWEMEEQRGRGRVVGQGSPRVLHRLNKVNLKKPPDQMCPQDCIVLCSVVIVQFTVKNSCE